MYQNMCIYVRKLYMYIHISIYTHMLRRSEETSVKVIWALQVPAAARSSAASPGRSGRSGSTPCLGGRGCGKAADPALTLEKEVDEYAMHIV